MLRLRFSRTGRSNQPKFRIVVAEHSSPIQGKFVEIVGTYNPQTKDFALQKERIEYWISKGAIPTDSAASFFKKNGMGQMDKYIGRRDFQRKKKKELKAEKAAGGTTAPATPPTVKKEKPADVPAETAPSAPSADSQPKEAQKTIPPATEAESSASSPGSQAKEVQETTPAADESEPSVASPDSQPKEDPGKTAATADACENPQSS